MEFVYNLFVVAHLLGMAALVGGWYVVATGGAAAEVMVWGARAQVLTGLVLVGMASALDVLDEPVNNTKIAVKLLVAIAAAACVEIARARGRRGEQASGLAHAGGGLGVVNVLVATLWN